MTHIYIIRHGETNLNVRGVLQGRLDEPLNQAGRDLAEITGRNMREIHFDRCISSPLVRAYETAEIVLRESGNDIPIEIDERIQEMNFGELEGKKLQTMGEVGMLFMTDSFRFPGFPGGENFRQLCDRTQDFLKELGGSWQGSQKMAGSMAESAEQAWTVNSDVNGEADGPNILVATHGCALRAMLNFLYEDPTNFWQENVPYNCCVNIVEADGDGLRLVARDKIYYPEEMIVDRYKG